MDVKNDFLIPKSTSLPNIEIALQELENELKCSACQQASPSLCSLGMCEHLFCSPCTSDKISRVCPICKIPFNAKDIKMQGPLTNIINISNQLRDIFFHLEPDSSFDESKQDSEKSQETDKEIIFVPKESKLQNSKIEVQSNLKEKPESFERDKDRILPTTKSTNKRKSLSDYSSTKITPSKKTVSVANKPKIISRQTDSNSNTPKTKWKSCKSTPKLSKKPERNIRCTPKSTGSPSLSVQPSPSPKIKKNAKGETPLHVAVIKGDIEKVKALLSDAIDLNIKDHAGWTPLHEACNHGHDQIAQLLLDNGALINIPGPENDTPLHDAVINGRVKCVELLVSRGASLTLRNVHGLVPKDYAMTDLMKEAFNTPVLINSSTNHLLEISLIDGGPLCILGTALPREEKIELQKRAAFLQAKVVEAFNPEVTHIVSGVNKEGMCPRTLKYLKGVLAGKWIVTLDWLRTCEEYGERVSEEPFEIIGSSTHPNSMAPYNGRINRLKQLPRLFNGCQFYFHGTFKYPTPDKEALIDLVKFGEGHVLSREPKLHSLDPKDLTVPFHAANSDNDDLNQCGLFIIHDKKTSHPLIRHKQMCSAPANWIMESIASFRLSKLPEN